MNDENGNLVEMVEFRAIAPKANLKGLDEAQAKLNQLDTTLKTLQNRLAGLTTGSAFRLSAAQFSSKIPTSGPQSVRQLAKLWGFPDVKDVQTVAREVEGELQKSIDRIQRKLERTPVSPRGSTRARDALKQQIKELQAQSMFIDPLATTLKNPTRAGQFAELYSKRMLTNRMNAEKAILGLLGGVPAGALPAAPVYPVQPPLESAGPKKTRKRAASSGGSGGGESGDEPSGKKQTAGSKFADALEKIKLELEENLNTGDRARIPAARLQAAEQVKALVDADSEGKIKERTKDKAMRYAATQRRMASDQSQKLIMEHGDDLAKLQLDKAKAIAAGDKETAKLLKEQEAALKRTMAASQQALRAVDAAFYKPMTQRRLVAERDAQSQASRAARATAGRNNIQYVSQAWQDFIAQGGVMTRDEMVMGKGGAHRELRGEMAIGTPGSPGAQTRVFSASIGEADAKLRSYSKAASEAKEKTGWLGSDFLTNTAKVAKWSLSVGVLYKTMGLAEKSFEEFLTSSGQMARLDQIFRKVGGSTQQLTSDILHLAAVNGRSGEEAMESAISWSRLGLSRIQVNEAVRLSLMAANVTQLTAAETTEHLQAISQNYGLTVGQLSAKLGEMVRISNIYNVTNADMLQGVSRSAAVAKQAGMSFEQLIGFIGATVGATKQTGANIGNAVKTIITSLSSPALQEKLRMLYGIQSESPGGHAKAVTDVLDEIYIRYQKLDSLQSRAMTFSISGKFQSQRLSAMLDNYVRAQVLAIDAQLHLNTADQENLKIVDSMKAQLAGLSAEWERFVVIQGNHGPATALNEIAKALRNVISLTNTSGGSWLTTAMLGIGTAATAKTVMTAMTTKAGAQGGWVGATQAKALEAAMALNGFTNQAIQGRYKRSLAAGKEARNARYSDFRSQGMTAGQAFALAGPVKANRFDSALVGMNNFGNTRLQAAARGFQEMRIAAGAMNATIGLTVKSLALASAALVEFAIPIAVVVGGFYLFNRAMDAMEGHAEASQKKLAGFNDEMERSASAARAMGGAAKLFDTAIGAFSPLTGYGAMPADKKKRMLEQLKDAMFLNEPDIGKRTTLQNNEFNRLMGASNGDVIKSLTAQKEGYFSAQQDRLQDEFEARTRKQEELTAQRAKLVSMQSGVWSGFGKEGRAQQIDEIDKQQAEINGQIVDSYQEQAGLTDEILSTDQKVTAELAKQKALLEAVGAVFSNIHTNNPMEKLAVERTAAAAKVLAIEKQIAALNTRSRANAGEQATFAQKQSDNKAQEDAARAELANLQAAQVYSAKRVRGDQDTNKKFNLGSENYDSDYGQQLLSKRIADKKDQIDSFEKRNSELGAGIDPDNPSAVTETARLQKLTADAQQQLVQAKNAQGALDQSGMSDLAKQQTQMEIGQQQSQRVGVAADYGVNEGDKLIRERQAYTEDIAKTEQEISRAEAAGTDTLELKGRLLEDIYQRNKGIVDILNEQAQVEQQIKQLKIDQNREFMKSFMTSGPAEMLQKLGALKLAGGGPMSQGSFFSMSPGMRENYGQLNPKFNPDMIQLLMARGALSGAVKGFAAGGYTGDGNPKDIAGVVHRGEYVIPADQMDANGIPKTTAAWAAYDAKKNGWQNTSASQQRDIYAQQAQADAAKHGWQSTTSSQQSDFYRHQAADDAAKNGWQTTTENQRNDFYAQQAAADKRTRDADWEREFGGKATASRPPTLPSQGGRPPAHRPDATWRDPRTGNVLPNQSGINSTIARDAHDNGWRQPVHDLGQAKARAFGMDGSGRSGSGSPDAAAMSGSAQFQSVLASIPKALQTAASAASDAMTTAASKINAGSDAVLAALNGLATKLNGFSAGNWSSPQTAQAGGLGGGRGYSRHVSSKPA